ncbi:MAG: S8 family serine peptidase [Candidatus Heimdallarchaeum endolithica]|uniref:S8 family serine peptidase n=1 Tax=Candidatus Heimdallarchaeum endolithica TaxID=2876572 RepID=A0A9Y1BPT4_9ARCH|nr:MAG: S8 family serine peptidase [Candidatus Heimdallarchaeum endolithica]
MVKSKLAITIIIVLIFFSSVSSIYQINIENDSYSYIEDEREDRQNILNSKESSSGKNVRKLTEDEWIKLDPGNKTVAILDTGINLNHFMFDEEQLVHWKDFVGSSVDEENDLYDEPTDVNGHGTAVSSIIAGKNNSALNYSFSFYTEPRYFVPVKKFYLRPNETLDCSFHWEEGIEIRIFLVDGRGIENIDSVRVDTGEYHYVYTSKEEKTRYLELSVGNLDEENGAYINGTIHYPLLEEYTGICPGAKIIALKVLDDEGKTTYDTVLDALDYLKTIKEQYNITVVNLSFRLDSQVMNIDDKINELADEGLVVVATSGDEGSNSYINSPGTAKKAITVGNANKNGKIEPSAHGNTYYGLKPDLMAFGGSMGYTQYALVADAKNEYDVIPQASPDLSCAYISAVALSMTASNWEYTWEKVAKVKQIILLHTYESSGTAYYNYPEPTKDYFGKDNFEGWGIYQYGLPIELAIENIGDTVNFQTVLDRKNGDAVRVYAIQTREEYNYTINVETNITAVVALVSEQTDEDGDLIVEDVSLTSNMKKTFNLFGYGEIKYLVFRSMNDSQAIDIQGSLISSRRAWVIVHKTNIQEYTTRKSFYLNISYGNGLPSLILDGGDITAEAQETRYYFSYSGLEIGEHTLEFTVKSSNSSWSEEWKYTRTWNFTIIEEKQKISDSLIVQITLVSVGVISIGAILWILFRRKGIGGG